jgi:asparagine synthase (glutamine-hydrolysing)
LDAAVDEICDHLLAVCGEVAAAFPERVRTALSGGFDSRLIIAGLLASGSHPELFVYGDSTSEDVPIARGVADSVGIALNIVDKSALNLRMPPPDLERLVGSVLFFDGLPNDGIHDRGADQQTRLAQNAGGCIALNGGGGEIFRNFFHLPDRALCAVDIVRAFYRGFDPKVFRRPHGLSSYEDGLVASIGRALGLEDVHARQKLGRKQVELLYPLFRCHHWMGVNNSVGVRHGYYATPLVDLKSVRLACSLPLSWKNAGRLESRLIARLHPGIANQPSAYGFRFADGPNRRARFAEWITCMRPVSARPYINALRRDVYKLGVAPGVIARCRSLLPGEWRLDSMLDLERLPDDQAFARALAVETVWREIVG